MSTISLIGDTHKIRASIKSSGFVWNANYSRWDKTVSEDVARAIKAGDLKVIGAQHAGKHGCALIVDGHPTIVWQSKTAPVIDIKKHVSAGFFADADTL